MDKKKKKTHSVYLCFIDNLLMDDNLQQIHKYGQ